MRWIIDKTERKEYERHVIRKFAFFPIRIDNEIRWLEFVNIEAYYWLGRFTSNKYWEYERFVD